MHRTRLTMWSVTAATLVLVAVGVPAHADVTVGDTAAIVVGDAAALTVGDNALVSELADIGYAPQVVDDSSPAATAAFVLLAPSSDASTLGGKYNNVTAPVLTLNVLTWNNLGLTSSAGSIYNTTNLLVIDGASPIVNGLSSTFTVSTTTDPLGSVNTTYVPASVDTVAARSSSSSAAVVLSLGYGGIRSDSTAAPAGRVAMGLTDAALDSLSDDGVQLIENAVYWLSGQVDPSVPKVAALRVAGKWNLNDKSTLTSNLPSNNQITNSTENNDGSFPGFGSTTTVKQNQAPVYISAGHSYYFPGWHNMTSTACPGDPSNQCDSVSSNASLATVADLSNVFSPGVAPVTGGNAKPYWQMSIDIRADELTVETASGQVWDQPNGVGFGPASPNIIQQGKSKMNGQWKLSQHPVTGRSDVFTVSCDFEGAAPANEPRSAAETTLLSTQTDYQITCSLWRGGLPRISIAGGGLTINPTPPVYTETAYVVKPQDDVFIGKKSSHNNPGGASNTHANDAFAGYIDNIQIKTTS